MPLLIQPVHHSKNPCLRNARSAGGYLNKRLHELQDKYDNIGDVRGLGLMQPIDFVKNRKVKETKNRENRIVKDINHKVSKKIVHEAKKNGLGSWFTCLLYKGMEPTNNLAEQAIREHVVIQIHIL